MGTLDVTALLTDPDFVSPCTLIHRAMTVNTSGETVLAETSAPIVAVVQTQIPAQMLERVPTDVRLSDVIVVTYKGRLSAETPGGYSDVIVWNGRRYQVREIPENFMNYGAGFTSALCTAEAVSA